MLSALAVFVAALHTTVGAASSLTPPVLPLIVRNPYLSTWLGNARDVPWSKWPMFYTGEELGLSVMAHIPSTDTLYPLVGKPQDSLSHGAGYAQNRSIYSHSTPNKDPQVTIRRIPQLSGR